MTYNYLHPYCDVEDAAYEDPVPRRDEEEAP